MQFSSSEEIQKLKAKRDSRMHRKNPKIWLEVEGGCLQLIKEGEMVWQFPTTDLVLIGEYTTEKGPWAQDYYFVFGEGRPPQFYEVPLELAQPILLKLSEKLGHQLVPGLVQSTEWRSRVLWPPALEGQELFVRSVRPRPRGVVNRVKDALIPMQHVEFQSAIAEYLVTQAGGGDVI